MTEAAQDYLRRLTEVDPAKIEGVNGVFLFDLTGEGGGKWTLKVKDGKAELEEGEPQPPDVTISLAAEDFLKVASGEMNAVSAFMQGKIKISGDMMLAMRVQSILT
jgi:putative sterol carrier protein